MKYRSHWWSIEPSPGWIVEVNEDCTSIYKHDGVGALQISAYLKDQAITKEELLEFTAGEEIEPCAVAAFAGFKSSHSKDPEYWRKWWIASNHLLIFITYHSNQNDSHAESDEVDKMVSTLQSRV